MPVLHYKNPYEHTQFAKALRKQAPLAERLLWEALASLNKTTSLKFRRQHPLHPYVADFACVKARLIIELDGMSHDNKLSYDAARDAALRSKGWTIMRFGNDEVYENLEGLVVTITARATELMALRGH